MLNKFNYIETHCKEVSYVSFDYCTVTTSNYSSDPMSASP